MSESTALSSLDIVSSFWHEEPEEGNPFIAAKYECAGYNVHSDILKNANWVEYLYLLFKGEQPTQEQYQLLNALSIAIANPGPKDHSVQAAMSAGAGGSTMASSLMAALAVGAGHLGGAREVFESIKLWEECGTEIGLWEKSLGRFQDKDQVHSEPDLSQIKNDVWPLPEHPSGFDPLSHKCATPVTQTLHFLADNAIGIHVKWLLCHQVCLEGYAQSPLALTGVIAAAFVDLKLDPQQGEALFLLLRLPGAAAHALEQSEVGWRQYPFYREGIHLTNDPLERNAHKEVE